MLHHYLCSTRSHFNISTCDEIHLKLKFFNKKKRQAFLLTLHVCYFNSIHVFMYKNHNISWFDLRLPNFTLNIIRLCVTVCFNLPKLIFFLIHFDITSYSLFFGNLVLFYLHKSYSTEQPSIKWQFFTWGWFFFGFCTMWK